MEEEGEHMEQEELQLGQI